MRTVTPSKAICWPLYALVILTLAAPSSHASLTAISSHSPEFRKEYARHFAKVETVENMETITVHRLAIDDATEAPQFDKKGDFVFQTEVQTIHLAGFATPTDLKKADLRENPFLTEKELKRYLHFVPMIENHLRVCLVGQEIVLKSTEEQKAFRIMLAIGFRPHENPKEKHYLFSDLAHNLMNDGYLLPQVSRWKLIDPKQNFSSQPSDILYFRQSKTQKNGLWYKPEMTPEKFPQPALLVPLENLDVRIPKVELKWMPNIAFVLECSNEESATLAMAKSGQINRFLSELVDSMTKDQLHHRDTLGMLKSKLLAMFETNKELKGRLQIRQLHFSQYFVE